MGDPLIFRNLMDELHFGNSGFGLDSVSLSGQTNEFHERANECATKIPLRNFN